MISVPVILLYAGLALIIAAILLEFRTRSFRIWNYTARAYAFWAIGFVLRGVGFALQHSWTNMAIDAALFVFYAWLWNNRRRRRRRNQVHGAKAKAILAAMLRTLRQRRIPVPAPA